MTALSQFTTIQDAQWQQPNGKAAGQGASVNRGRALLSKTFATGVGASQADTWTYMQFTISASGVLAIDLQAGTYSGGGSGSLSNLVNQTVAFARIKGVKVKLKATAGGSTFIKVNAAATHANSAFHALIHSEGVAGGFEGWAEFWCPTAAGKVTTDGVVDILSIVEMGTSAAATVIVGVLGGAS